MKTKILFALLLISHFTFSQTFTESDPFLKWKATSNGLTYSSIIFEVNDGSLLSNHVARDLEIKIKVNQPKGFTEVNEEVFFGIGLIIYDSDVDTLIFESKDLYSEELEGIDPDILSNLSVDFTPTLASKNILIKIRFFDKKSDKDILFECPFILSDNSDLTNNSISYTKMFDLPSYTLIGQTVDCDGSYIENNNEPIKSLEFSSKEVLSFKTNIENIKSDNYTCFYTVYDEKGLKTASSQKTFTETWDGKFNFDFPKTLTSQAYLITFSVENDKGRIGFSQCFFFKDKPELTTQQKTSFANIFTNIALQKNNNDENREAQNIIKNANYYSANNIEVLIANGKINTEGDNYEEAVLFYELAEKNSPNNIEIKKALAKAYDKNNQREKSFEMYEKLIALTPSDFLNYYLIGWLYNDDKKYSEAIPYLDKAIEFNKDSSDTRPYDERIISNNSLGNFKSIIADYQKLLEYSPLSWEYYYKIGYAQTDLEDYKSAIISFTKAIELNEYITDAIYERGYAYQMLKDYKKAISDYTQTIKIGEGSEPSKTYIHRGDCYIAQGKKNWDLACKDFYKALELENEDAEAKLNDYCR